MDRRNPLHMNDLDLISEIHKVRDEIEERAMRLAELSRTLYSQARRRGVRQEFERMGDEIHDLESALRRASGDQATTISERLTKLRNDRQAHQERVSTYTVFANNWTRVAGMISQGLMRSRSTDRLLARLPVPDPDPEPETPPSPPPVQQESIQEPSAIEDLIDLYGEELLNADRR